MQNTVAAIPNTLDFNTNRKGTCEHDHSKSESETVNSPAITVLLFILLLIC